MKIKKIVLVVFSRANYSTIKGILAEIKKDKKIKYILIVGSSAIIEKYGSILKIIKDDGFKTRYNFIMS